VWVESPIDFAAEAREGGGAAAITATLVTTKYVKARCSPHALFVADLTRRSMQAKASALESALSNEELQKLGITVAQDSPISDGTELFKSISSAVDTVLVQMVDSGASARVEFSAIFPCNDDSVVAASADLTSLTFLEEPNILYSLEYRYANEQIYTAIAAIMVAVNPYRSLPIYSAETMKSYRRSASGGPINRIPHIYGVSEEAYNSLTAKFSKKWRPRPQNQSLIVCGESGSGKTENAKHIMRYLANRKHGVLEDSEVSQGSIVEKQIMETNYILEAFGNAATNLNYNSSRFGKFTKMYFNTSNLLSEEELKEKFDVVFDRVVGASTETYLLEKSRVVLQSKGERSFHIFYCLFQGFSEEEKTAYGLKGKNAKDFNYILQGVQNPEKASYFAPIDKQRYDEMIQGMEALGIDVATRKVIFALVSAVLHIGNIEFEEDKSSTEDACVIKSESKDHVDSASKLLGVTSENLSKRLITQRIKLPTEWINKKLNSRDARINRDAVSKALYENMFIWIVSRINLALEQDVTLPWIGILDVFGFEVFEINSFEQFCINFCNEKLQQHFNHSILISEQQEYARESILWTPLEVPDGQVCIDLIEKNVSGIFSLLDSACKMAATTVDYFTESIYSSNKGHPLLTKPDYKSRIKNRTVIKSKAGFVIRHYAGQVEYSTDEFLTKNNDRADADTVGLFSQSSESVIQSIFQIESSLLNTPKTSGGGRGSISTLRVTSAVTSVSKSFTKQLKVLLDTLGETSSYFIRCIKPNLAMKPSVFDHLHVRPQLQCGGIVQAVKMLKCGYPTRVAFDDIFKQYSPLLTCDQKRLQSLNRRHFCQAVLAVFGLHSKDFQLGLTKAFFKAEKRNVLHMILNYDKKLSPKQMKSLFRFLVLKKWLRLFAIVRSSNRVWRRIERRRALEHFCKMARFLAIYHRGIRKRHRRIRYTKASFRLQSLLHVFQARKVVRSLWEEKMERKRREEEAVRRAADEARLLEEARVMAEQAKKDAELAEARKKEEFAVERARIRAEREEAEKKAQLEAEHQRRREQEEMKQKLEENQRFREAEEKLRRDEQHRREEEARLREEEFHRRRWEMELEIAKAKAESELAAARAREEAQISAAKAIAQAELAVKLKREEEDRIAKLKEEQEQTNRTLEFERIVREAARLSAVRDHVPSDSEIEITEWIETTLGIQLSDFLADDLLDGMVDLLSQLGLIL